MQVRWQDRIVSTPDVLRGKPRIKNTRIPASLVLGYLAAGHSEQQIIAEYPALASEGIVACLDLARDLGLHRSTLVSDTERCD
ncbi:MAG: DUF433 domain-containing protein [Gemmataceae bacterium]